MSDNNTTKVEITDFPGGFLDVNLNGTDVTVGGDVSVTTEPRFYLVDIKKPYLINRNQIECVVGEWDKDKTTYGVRIFFASGNSVWCGGDSARDILRRLWGVEATKKFDEASKR